MRGRALFAANARAACPAYTQRFRRSIGSSSDNQTQGRRSATPTAIQRRGIARTSSARCAGIMARRARRRAARSCARRRPLNRRRSDRSSGTSALLRALVAERRARVQSRAASAAQTEHSHAARRHLAMNRGRVGREVDQSWKRDATSSAAPSQPALDLRDELMDELHRRRGTCRARVHTSPAARGGKTGGETSGSKCTAHAAHRR